MLKIVATIGSLRSRTYMSSDYDDVICTLQYMYVLTPDFPIVMTREISRRSLAIIVYQYYIGKGFQAVIELHLIGYDVKYIYFFFALVD